MCINQELVNPGELGGMLGVSTRKELFNGEKNRRLYQTASTSR